MKKIFLAVMMLLIMCKAGYGETSTVQVKLTALTPEIFVGQAIAATVQVTNIGTDAIQLPRPDRTGFSALLSTDNPRLGFSGGIGIVSVTGEAPTVIVKPGESISAQVSLSGTTHGLSPIIFRMGFKPTAQAMSMWSNPVTIRFKKDQDLPVKVEATIQDHDINISNIELPGEAVAHIRIINTSNAPQYIGIDGDGGLHELQSLVSNNPSLQIISGISPCLMPKSGPGLEDVTLKPGETYEQDCRVGYWGENPNPQPIAFRIGVKSVGHLPAWSNPLAVHIVGGTDAWRKHIAYEKNLIKEYTTPHPDGTDKK